jgi:hypothetical protein
MLGEKAKPNQIELKMQKRKFTFFRILNAHNNQNGIKVGSFNYQHIMKPYEMLVHVQNHTEQEI